jgi:hypothetical protein
MIEAKHLWEIDHPYYCSTNEDGDSYDSWDEFVDNMDDADLDLNLLFRFDWHLAEDVNPEIEQDELKLFYVAQRKGYVFECTVMVNKEDEPRIIEWLKIRLAYLNSIWQPLD